MYLLVLGINKRNSLLIMKRRVNKRCNLSVDSEKLVDLPLSTAKHVNNVLSLLINVFQY